MHIAILIFTKADVSDDYRVWWLNYSFLPLSFLVQTKEGLSSLMASTNGTFSKIIMAPSLSAKALLDMTVTLSLHSHKIWDDELIQLLYGLVPPMEYLHMKKMFKKIKKERLHLSSKTEEY